MATTVRPLSPCSVSVAVPDWFELFRPFNVTVTVCGAAVEGDTEVAELPVPGCCVAGVNVAEPLGLSVPVLVPPLVELLLCGEFALFDELHPAASSITAGTIRTNAFNLFINGQVMILSLASSDDSGTNDLK